MQDNASNERTRRRLRIISGGQTGVDRAALDMALELGFPCGGWCPRGRRAEDGPIDMRYPLQECESEAYRVRTRLNVLDADATLILAEAPLSGGTRLTEQIALELARPVFVCEPDRPPPDDLLAAIVERPVHALNVAGPRGEAGVYTRAQQFMQALLSRLR